MNLYKLISTKPNAHKSYVVSEERKEIRGKNKGKKQGE